MVASFAIASSTMFLPSSVFPMVQNLARGEAASSAWK